VADYVEFVTDHRDHIRKIKKTTDVTGQKDPGREK
jgi:hypothetical protein